MAEAEKIKAKKLTEDQILTEVKNALGIKTNYQDETIKPFLKDVIFYLSNAGVSALVINSSASVGVIIRGVSDLWNYGSGGTTLSPYFKERVIQLATAEIVIEEEAAENG